MSKLHAVTLVHTIFILSICSTSDAQTVNITGRVVNSFQNPLSGCIISFSSATMNGFRDTTAADGLFRISNVTSVVFQKPIHDFKYSKNGGI